MKRDFQYIWFDLGHVIINIDYQKTFDKLVVLLSSDMPEEERMQQILHLNEKYETGEISTELFINHLLSYCPPHVHAKQIIDAWNAMLLDIPMSRIRFLQRLQSTYQIAILSNTNPLHITWVNSYLSRSPLRWDSLYRLTDHVYYSHDLKDHKPNPSIYQKVLQKLQVPASACLFIDDKLENLEGAAAVGIYTLHSPPEKEVMDQLKDVLSD